VSLIISAIPTASGNLWRPPFLYNISANSFAILVGVGILFLIPDLVKKMRELVGIKDTGISFGAGTFFGGIAGLGGAATGGLTKLGGIGYQAQYMGKIPFVGPILQEKLPKVFGEKPK
jgi:hypothetical protein